MSFSSIFAFLFSFNSPKSPNLSLETSKQWKSATYFNLFLKNFWHLFIKLFSFFHFFENDKIYTYLTMKVTPTAPFTTFYRQMFHLHAQ